MGAWQVAHTPNGHGITPSPLFHQRDMLDYPTNCVSTVIIQLECVCGVFFLFIYYKHTVLLTLVWVTNPLKTHPTLFLLLFLLELPP